MGKAWDGISWLISEERRERPYMLPDPSDPETPLAYLLANVAELRALYLAAAAAGDTVVHVID